MKKKSLVTKSTTFASLLVAMLMMVVAHTNAVAETYPVGQWTYHPGFSYPPEKVIETENIVYYMACGRLFSYYKDEDGGESHSYDGVDLNDCEITDIYYNSSKNYLLVAYESGNLDFVYDDGSVVNVSDIVDSSVTGSLEVNDVHFGDGVVYVATDFGLVEINDDTHLVVQSGIYNTSVDAVTVMSSYLVIYADGSIYAINKDSRYNNLNKFTAIDVLADTPMEFYALDYNRMLVRCDSGTDYLSLVTIDFTTMTATISNVSSSHSTYSSYLSTGSDGSIYYVADNNLYSVSSPYESETWLCSLPSELQDTKIGTLSGMSSLWSLSEEGIGNYTVSSSGTLTVNMQRYVPEDLSVSKVYYLYPTPDQNYVVAQNLGSTNYRYGMYTSAERRGRLNVHAASRINLLTGEKTDFSLYPVTTTINSNATNYATVGDHATAIMGFVPDPDDPDVYYLPCPEEGLFKVKNGELVGKYDYTNSPIQFYDNRSIVYGASIDRGGNLWVNMFHCGYANSPIAILPAAKRQLDPSEVTEDDWYVPDLSSVEYWGGQDVMYLHCQQSNMIFIIDSTTTEFMLAYDTNGTFSNFADDTFYLWEYVTDQDGNIFQPSYRASICEDHNGKVWIGTSEGVVIISSPSRATNSSMTVTHAKVPRNDGTNLADYLLGTDLINSISVDPSNRKWLATDASGLYLVSEDGDEIIESFTSDDSPLLSNRVNAVYADPNSSTVYVGMSHGLYTYSSNSTPGQDDYSSIYAYPNPVRPTYSGDIYIIGLMDESLVKIADSAGNVVWQGRSEAGMATWDGCNLKGRRVPSGVYYVYASQNATGSAEGAVTKILIIR